MQRLHMASILGAGVLAAALTGCNSVDNPIGQGGEASVKVDGVALNLPDKSVGCVTSNGRINISVGSKQNNSGIAAVITDGDNPQVLSVGLGAVNSVTLGFVSGIPGGGSATVTKSLKTYTIAGEATGVNISNLTQPSKKHFELKVRCP